MRYESLLHAIEEMNQRAVQVLAEQMPDYAALFADFRWMWMEAEIVWSEESARLGKLSVNEQTFALVPINPDHTFDGLLNFLFQRPERGTNGPV